MYRNGMGYANATRDFADSVNGLIKAGNQELAQKVVDSTMERLGSIPTGFLV